ncbi:MAG: TrkH family potassium uptake protein [Lachnospiraceae bacterium]|nr:TrkH family potassium uptake protein [Lachnospiraceae bacterium]
MNHKSIIYILGKILQIEALFLMLPLIVSIIYREDDFISFLITIAATGIIGTVISLKKPPKSSFYAREGFVMVALGWLVMSVMGALPFVINGDIPDFTDAFFETVSGFTTTGSSILTDVEHLSHASLFWRSLTHWIGGMGVFVFMLAIMPMTGASNMHLMRSESPGPEVGKLVPRLRDTAKILYRLYFALSVLMLIILVATGMDGFDAVTITFGTAGTGGFAIKNTSIASYTACQQIIISVFMILFGINFNFFYFLTFGKSLMEAFRMEEIRVYLLIIAGSVAAIMINAGSMFTSVFDGFVKSLFQVSSIITTTGFGTTDFDLWPSFSKSILVCLMFIGACAGSTGGGIKVSRITILFKVFHKELAHFIHPRLVRNIHMNGRVLKDETVDGVKVYMGAYLIIFVISVLFISIEGHDPVTNFTAVAATMNNIGPGLAKVGPACNFSFFSAPSKYVLMFDMLAGRLELYPMLLLFAPTTWRDK